MKPSTLNSDSLKAIIEYILWDYDCNVSPVNDKEPIITVKELSNVFCVKISYKGDLIIVNNSSSDPTTHKKDEIEVRTAEFNLLKNQGFLVLQKYVHDICDEMSK